jgi:hypothetical protein
MFSCGGGGGGGGDGSCGGTAVGGESVVGSWGEGVEGGVLASWVVDGVVVVDVVGVVAIRTAGTDLT